MNGCCESSGSPFVVCQSRWLQLRLESTSPLRTPGVNPTTPEGPIGRAASPVDSGAMESAEKVCIIGAGSSGIVAAQVLGAKGIAYDCFEKGSQIGGNWRFENDNGMSSAYRSLHINTSRRVMAFKTLPM